MRKEEGLTLIEVIISIALTGVLAMVFLSMFDFGNRNIIRAGDRTEDVLEIQKIVDGEIKDPVGPEETKEDTISGPSKEIKKIDSGKKTIKIKILEELEPEEIEVKGNFVTVIEKESGIKITTFIPNKVSNEEN